MAGADDDPNKPAPPVDTPQSGDKPTPPADPQSQPSDKPPPETQILRPKLFEEDTTSKHPSTGYQAERVEKKLDQLEAEGIVLVHHAVGVLRHMVEQKFKTDDKLGFGPPSRQTMDRVIKRRRRP